MAADNEYAIPEAIISALRGMGYEPDTSMQEHVRIWREWITATAPFYDSVQVVGKRRFRVTRMSLHPARRVCREWASLILDDRTTVSADKDRADAWLKGWASRTHFLPRAQGVVERAFGLGTAALALAWDGDRVVMRDYDARGIVPLSWSPEGCTECAFCSRSSVAGRRVDQVQAHVLRGGTYRIVTRVFDGESGEEVHPDGVEPEFETGVGAPTFALLRPAIDNVVEDFTPMGQSVIEDALDAVRAVDNAFDSMQQEIDATKVKIFMSDDLFDVDDDGAAVPMSPDNVVIRKVAGNGVDKTLEIFAPSIRIDPLRTALDTALADLGDLTGFGRSYFRYDQGAGLKTATEVSADNSALMRTTRKHENLIGDAMSRALEALLAMAGSLEGADVEPGAHVTVDFDDSIITDTLTERQMAMSEVAAGIMQPWEYRVRFFGEGEEAAREAVGDADGVSDSVAAIAGVDETGAEVPEE